MTIKEKAASMKLISPKMAAASIKTRNHALAQIIDKLLQNENMIMAANEKDLAEAEKNQIPEAVVKRLKFSKDKMKVQLMELEN